METVAWRFWTRVTRANTIESTAGRVLYLNFGFVVVDVVFAGVVEVEESVVLGRFRETLRIDFTLELG
jgi:hypothetical protein